MGAVSQERLLSSTCFVIAGQSIYLYSKFKHLKYSENVNFTGTNSIESILVDVTSGLLEPVQWQLWQLPHQFLRDLILQKLLLTSTPPVF